MAEDSKDFESIEAISDEREDADDETEEHSDEELHQQAIEHFNLCVQAESETRRLSKEDIEFVLGDQWPIDIRNERREDGRPCLTINRTAQVVNQITNDQRQNKPSIKVSPVDDQADIETAKVRQGLIRHIEYDSNADIAYSNAFEFAVMGGFGFWRVITQYADPTSSKQEVKIDQVKNPFSAYLDPSHKKPDGSDAEFGFIFDDISKESFERQYPESDLVIRGFESIGDQAPMWLPSGSVRIAEYFYKKYTADSVLVLSTGEEILRSKLSGMPLPMGISIVSERKTKIPSIGWLKLNGKEILEKGEFPGRYIPIIPAYGKEFFLDGKRILKGITRDAKDPARMYNFMASAEAEAIALAPKAPFIVAEGQIEGYENVWKLANRKNNAYLPYKPTSVNGSPVPPPQRNSFEPAVQAITNSRMISGDDIKATTGVYDASLGAQSNETSGVAIQRRNNQAQTSNFHFIDNLNKSIRHTGRIINDIIPVVYDTPQTARILGDEGDERVVHINRPFQDNGKEAIYDMSVGKYDVTIDTGPSFQTKRQEAVASMLDMARAAPQIMQAAPDIIAKNMDWPGSQEIADRLKKTLPPGLADDNKNKEIPPQVQAQMQQMGQMVEQLTKQLNQVMQEKEQKLVELQSKERIEFKKLEVELEIARAKLETQGSLAILDAEVNRIQNHINQIPEIAASMSAPQQMQPTPQSSEPNAGAMGVLQPAQPQPTGGFSPGQTLGDNP